MKILFAVLLSIVLITPLAGQQVKKTTLAVLDFDAKGIRETEASILSDRFRSELVKTKLVTVIERSQMNTILNEIGFQQTGCTSSECLVEIGKILNVQKMIHASVGRFANVYTIDIRMIDVGTSEILSSISEDHEGQMSGLLEIIKDLAQRMANSAAGIKTVKKEESSNFWWWTTAVAGVAVAGALYYFSVTNGNGNGEETLPVPPSRP